jgi:hypothetical protein
VLSTSEDDILGHGVALVTLSVLLLHLCVHFPLLQYASIAKVCNPL